MARPYQISLTKLWTVDLEIRRNGRRQSYSLGERYRTEREANAGCTSLARRIVDGEVPGSSVDHLRDRSAPPRGGNGPAERGTTSILASLVKIGLVTLLIMALLLAMAEKSGQTQLIEVLLVMVGVGALVAALIALSRYRGRS